MAMKFASLRLVMPVHQKVFSGKLSMRRLLSKHPWLFRYGTMGMEFQFRLHCKPPNKVSRDCSKVFISMKMEKVFIYTQQKHGTIPGYARCMKEEYKK